MSLRVVILASAVALPLALAACHRAEQEPVQGQRIALGQVPSHGERPLPSPDTKGASWSEAADGHALDFGIAGAPPFLTLICNDAADGPQVTIVRHVAARAGEKALFPVIGNGRISRFKVDAARVGGEWRWQGTVSADDPLLDVFKGSHALEATLPGGGTLKVAGSAMPGEFIAHCREGAKPQ